MAFISVHHQRHQASVFTGCVDFTLRKTRCAISAAALDKIKDFLLRRPLAPVIPSLTPLTPGS
jgi:hypothetical protein